MMRIVEYDDGQVELDPLVKNLMRIGCGGVETKDNFKLQ